MFERDENEWADSFMKFFEPLDFWANGASFLRRGLRICNASAANREALISVYRGHKARVLDYFTGPDVPNERRQRFLMLNLQDPYVAWKLCDFSSAVRRHDCASIANSSLHVDNAAIIALILAPPYAKPHIANNLGRS